MSSRYAIALLCLLLIAARVSGAHWHLCFDGSEPPQTMHVGDIDLHTDHIADQHQDVDLKLVGEALAKNFGNGLDAPLLLAGFILLWLFQFPRRSSPFTHHRDISFIPDVFPRHAPPRAPPF